MDLLGQSLDTQSPEGIMNINTRSNPVFFLLLFALISLLLLPLWNEIGEGYIASLSSIVNHANLWLGLPSEFAIQPQPGEHTITPGIVAGIALFIATPNRSARWKIAWIAALLLTFGALQSLFMILQVQIAYAEFFAQLPFPQRVHYDPPAMLSLRLDSAFAHIIDLGKYWTNSLFYLIVWIIAIRN